MYLVCGEALFDFFLDSNSSDRPGSLTYDARVGGSPFNVAVGIARMGGQSALLTGISNDLLGEQLFQYLQDESVNTDYLVRSNNNTTISLVGVDKQGHPAYTFYGENSADRSLTHVQLPKVSDDIIGIHFGSYSIAVSPVAEAFSVLAASLKHRFISLDPNVRLMVEPNLEVWRERVSDYAAMADLIKISSEDMANLYPGVSFEKKAAEWLAMGVKLVIVTDGGNEVVAWSHKGLHKRVVPSSINVVDTVGAGDTFQAGLLTRLAELGDPITVLENLTLEALEELITFAVRASSITCARRGADLPYRSDVGSFEQSAS